MTLPSRPLTSVRMQVEFAAEQGLAREICLAGSGISLDQLMASDATIEASQELRVVENLCQHLGNRADLGLAMGQRYPLSSYGVWGFALLSSPTFRQAIDIGLRFLDLTFAFHRMTLHEETDRVRLLLEANNLPDTVNHYLLARDASAIMLVQQELFASRIPLNDLALCLPAQNPVPFQAVFGIVPRFEQPVNEAVFEARLLSLPLPQANPMTARLCEQQCEQLLAQRRHRGGLAARVRQRLLAQPGQFPTMAALAGEWGMTPRTLRRRLHREGTRYQELLDEVRRMLAEQWLQHGGLNQEEISARLGFSDVSNFNHAFRRWTGQTPAQFRRSI